MGKINGQGSVAYTHPNERIRAALKAVIAVANPPAASTAAKQRQDIRPVSSAPASQVSNNGNAAKG
ncbi:hypothetical protein ACVWWO_003667 [Bradyrhizobium sp. F1.13.1]